jgi:hypothetical protein
MKLTIFNCRRPYELFTLYKESHGVYIPVERRRRVDAKTHKTVVSFSAAMIGLVFVPLHRAPDFRRDVPEHFRIRQMYDQNSRPRIVELSELITMQEILNREFEGEVEEETADDELWLNIGDCVEVTAHTYFSGLRGEVQRIRSCGKVRLKVEGTALTNIVEIPKKFLRKCA